MALRPNKPESPEEKRAERDAAQQDVFLREVDDALRQDEMVGAFKRYGLALGVVIVLGLAAFAGVLWWNNARATEAGEHGEQLTLAIDNVDQGKLVDAGKQLDTLASDAADGSKAAAQMLRAGVALQQGQGDAALKLFAQVAADEDAPQPYRDLAAIREVAANFDAMPPQRVVDRLKRLAVPGNPWFGSAGELVGLAYVKLNRNELAGPLFAAIARDREVPESMRNRARQLSGLLGVDAIDDVARAAGMTQP